MRKNTLTAILGALAIISVVPVARAEIASREYVDDMDEKAMYGSNPSQMRQAIQELGGGYSDSASEFEEKGWVPTSLMLMGEIEDVFVGKQTALGGTNNTGVVVATGTAGTVSYTGIDSTPTAGSNNLVTSGGVAAAIAAAAPTVDATPTANSTNLVSSGGVAAAVADIGSNAIAVEQRAPDSFLITNAEGQVRTVDSIDPMFLSGGIGLNQLKLPSPPSSCSTQGCMLMFYNNQYVWEPIMRDTNETISTSGAVDGISINSRRALGQVRAADGTMVGEEPEPQE